MHIELLLLLAAAIANISLGFLVWYKARKLPSGLFFALTMVGVALWAVGDIVVLKASSSNIILLGERIFYAAPMFIPVTLLFFALTFPERHVPKRIIFGGSALTVALAALVVGFPEFLIKAVESTRSLNIPIPHKPGFILYAAFFSVVFMAVYIALFLSYRREQAVLSKAQLRYTFVGAILASVPALFTNLSLPILGHATLVWLGPLFTTLFVVAIAISIVRHKMFDIRLFVVRAAAYVAALTVLAALFGIVVFATARILFHIELNIWVQVYISVGTALAALAFSHLKRFFDKVTNSLFYRDAYDTQTLFDGLNRLLVANANIEVLLQHTATVINENFKTEFCFFIIPESDHASQRVIGEGGRLFKSGELAQLRALTPHIRKKVIVSDELDEKYSPLKAILQNSVIAILARLTPNVNTTDEGMGYLVLGARRSGNPYTVKDIRTLEIIVNELVISIENSLRFEEIQHFNDTLQQRIGEATTKLQATNRKLQDLDITKDEFITMASHQLRTPLTSVKGYLSMVLEGDAGKLNAGQRKLLEQSYISAQRMVYLIADLLNLSRLNTGKFVILPVKTNLAEVVQAEVDQLRETAKSRSLTLTYTKPATFPELMLDETKVRQVVMNFIDNAIYYTPAGGKINVELRETPTTIEYLVKDTGMGVPRTEQHHLFSKFYRADNAKKARPDGTGLGLFMAKKIIVAQGGAITFESTEGKGSTFGFRFNKRTHKVPPAETV